MANIVNQYGQVKLGVRYALTPSITLTPLLDTYGGALVGYSLRKLSSTYSGPAIRVRRSSDDTTLDVGFKADGTLDTTALLSFVGSGSGYVSIWYDQSGNNNQLFKTSSANQPRIVNAGVLETVGGKPAIRWITIGNVEHLMGLTTGLTNVRSVFLNITYLSGVGMTPLLGHTSLYDYHADGSVYLSTAHASSYVLNGTKYINGVSKTNATFTKSSSNSLISMIHTSASGRVNQISSDRTIGRWFDGYYSEIVLYSTDQSTNRAAIESNINSYYSIYTTDVDAQAFITAAAITDTTQQSAITTLVTDLKTANIWTKMKAIYPFVGGTAAQHRFNLKDPRAVDAAYYLTFYGGGTHSATGYLPNGNSYADTKLNPNTALTSMNQHISYYSRTNSTAATNDNGCQDDLISGTGKNIYALWGASYLNYYIIQTPDANQLTFGDTNSLGLILASRTSSTLLEGHRNGIKKTQSTTPTASGKPNINVYLGALNYRNGAGTMSTYYGVRETAFASIGDGLTSAEAANFYTAVQTYQTTLGRAV